jgi:carotenoid 1,2-hydratase
VPAERHVAVNVVLQGPSRSAWSMTERGRNSLERGPDFLRVGPSELIWRDDALVIQLDELGCPWPARIRGAIRLHPLVLPGYSCPLDLHGQHWWSPLAPLARVEVDLEQPRQCWSGAGYLDTNGGAAPLEQDFAGWHWLRTGVGPGAAVLYDVLRNDGSRLELALAFARGGGITHFPAPPLRSLGRSTWRLDRHTRCEDQGAAHVTRTLLDTPFYARSVIATRLQGQCVTGIHESLSLQRFSSRLVQAMLAFRMPRRARPVPRRRREGDDRDPTPPAR